MNIKTKKMVNTAQPILAINSDIYTIPLYVYPTKVFVLSNVTDSVAEAFLNTRGVPKDDAIDFVYREDNEPGLTFSLKEIFILDLRFIQNTMRITCEALLRMSRFTQ